MANLQKMVNPCNMFMYFKISDRKVLKKWNQ